MPINAAQLLVRINTNAAAAKAELTGFAATLGAAGPVGLAAGVAGVAVAGVGILATKMAGDFQSGMTSIVTGAGESAKNLDMLSKGVLGLARDTGTSTQQLVSGLYMIESGGYRGSAALDILKNAAEGAKVGSADLGTVADATDTILKNFGDQGLTSAQAVNTLIATVANGKTHMEDLAQALSQVLPTGAAAGIGLKDVMGAMATMTGEGVPAAEAATYLRQTIIALMAPGTQAKGVLQSIGLTSTEVADAMHKSLPAALQLIHDHLVKKFPEGSAAYIAAMREIAGGSKQMQGMLDLGGHHLKTFAELTKTVGDAAKHGGTQITGWALVQKNLNQQVDKAREVFETLMIELGQKLLPVATRLFGWLADNAIPTMKGIIEFMTGTSTQAQILRPVLAVLAIAIGGALVAAFVAWAISAAAAAVATIAATWPILLIGAAIALLIAGIILLVTHFSQVQQALGWVRDRFGDLLGTIGDFVGNALGALGRFFQAAWTWFTQLRDGLIQKVKDIASGVVTWLETMGLNALVSIGKFEISMVNKGKEIASNFINFFTSLPGKMLTLGEDLIRQLAKGISNAAGNVAAAVKNVPLIGGMAGKIASIIPHFAGGGTMDHDGLAVVGDGGEPEIVNLHRGDTVTPVSRLRQGQIAALPAGMGHAITLNLTLTSTTNIDGKRAAQAIMPHVHSVIRNATGARNF